MSDNYNSIYQAKVVNSTDPENRKRVRLIIPQISGIVPSAWAQPVGFGSVPDTGSLVWAMFTGGEIDKPVYFPSAP